MRKHRPLACATAVVGALAIAGPAVAAPPTNTEPLRKAVTVEGMKEHLAALRARATPFRGIPTRATGTPGHELSQDYVVEKMKAAGLTVTKQPFEADIFFEQGPAAFERVSPDPVVYPRYDGQTGVWYTADFSGDGDVTAPITAVDFKEPTTTARPACGTPRTSPVTATAPRT